MAGFGSQFNGSSPYGIGTPAVYTGNAGRPLQDEQDVQHGSRYIDSLTKDYVIDENGRLGGMSNIHQLVLLAVSTTRGSAAVRTLGHDLRNIDRITTNFTRRVDATLRTALRDLTSRGLIEVVSVSTEQLLPGRAYARLRWRDLTTGSADVIETFTS